MATREGAVHTVTLTTTTELTEFIDHRVFEPEGEPEERVELREDSDWPPPPPEEEPRWRSREQGDSRPRSCRCTRVAWNERGCDGHQCNRNWWGRYTSKEAAWEGFYLQLHIRSKIPGFFGSALRTFSSAFLNERAQAQYLAGYFLTQ